MKLASPLTASVIVRSLNKADSLGKTIDSIRKQTCPAEVVVVDSGSTDGTLELAQRYADRVICIKPEEFSYGGALNLGSQSCETDIHFALSAHCVAPSDKWVQLSLAHYEDPAVAATNGALSTPAGHILVAPHCQTTADVLANPIWGFSNHASSWRASVLEAQPFSTKLAACEDKEWSWRILLDGGVIVFDPSLCVDNSHRRRLGTKSLWKRVVKESQMMTELQGFRSKSIIDLLQQRWRHHLLTKGTENDSPISDHGGIPSPRQNKYFRFIEVLAEFEGQRRADSSAVPAPIFRKAYNPSTDGRHAPVTNRRVDN